MWNEMVKDEEIVFDREESASPGKNKIFVTIDFTGMNVTKFLFFKI